MTDASQWLDWAHEFKPPLGEDQPALKQIPPMARRRMSRLGRVAVQAVLGCRSDESELPMVFASRYGDVVRSLGLLEDFVRDGTMSPNGFSLSVHNAIAAMYSIALEDRSNVICVAGGRASAAAGLIETAGLLCDSTPEVLLVCYDEALPVDYACYRDEPPCIWAWAWRVALPAKGEGRLSLRSSAAVTGAEESTSLPASLDVFRHFLAGNSLLVQNIDGRRLEWQRHV